jgi:alpha-beta hydrolase superfamily lysophospholipase
MKALNLSTIVLTAAALVAGIGAGAKPAVPKEDDANQDASGRYADVNGLRMYYEIHGTGRPLVLLHGAFGFATVYPGLAKDRQIIAVELQGHGHTGDIDRPLSPELMADDVAALLKELKIEQADVFGHSMGASSASGSRSGIRRSCASWPSTGPSSAAWRMRVSPTWPGSSRACAPPTSRRR